MKGPGGAISKGTGEVCLISYLTNVSMPSSLQTISFLIPKHGREACASGDLGIGNIEQLFLVLWHPRGSCREEELHEALDTAFSRFNWYPLDENLLEKIKYSATSGNSGNKEGFALDKLTPVWRIFMRKLLKVNVKKAVHYFPWTVWTLSPIDGFLMCRDVILVSSVPISFLATSQLCVRTEDCPFPDFPGSCGALSLVTAKHPLSCLLLNSNWWRKLGWKG